MKCLIFLFFASNLWSQQSQVNNGSSGGGGGTVTSVTGTAPITSSGGNTPAIGFTPTLTSTFTVNATDTTGYSVKTSSGLNLGNGCVLFGDGTQQCTRTPLTPSYSYTSAANTTQGFPLVQLSSGDVLIGGYSVNVTTFNADGWSDWPAVATPSPLVTGDFWYGTDNNFHYSPDGTKILSVLSSTFTASGTPGGASGNVQSNNGSGGFAGAAQFNITTSSVVVTETFQSTGTTIIGKDTGACGALVSVGTTGNRCAGSGNNFTDHSLLVHNNGGACVTVADQSDANESNLCVDSTGARTGPNVSGTVHSLTYSTNNSAIRIGGTGAVTVGRIATQDAGTNAALYINYPSTAAVGGNVFSNVSSTNTIGNTNETGLYENLIKANTLKNNGDCIILTCAAHGSANANTKRLRIRFNNTTASSIDGSLVSDTGAQAANGSMLNVMARVCKSNSNAQTLAFSEANGAGVIGGALANPAMTATDTSDINVSCTCQNGTGTSGDCVGNAFTGDYSPAP